jgi:hypothetical protein
LKLHDKRHDICKGRLGFSPRFRPFSGTMVRKLTVMERHSGLRWLEQQEAA